MQWQSLCPLLNHTCESPSLQTGMRLALLQPSHLHLSWFELQQVTIWIVTGDSIFLDVNCNTIAITILKWVTILIWITKMIWIAAGDSHLSCSPSTIFVNLDQKGNIGVLRWVFSWLVSLTHSVRYDPPVGCGILFIPAIGPTGGS